VKRADTLKGRVLRELRRRALPVSTGDLSALCAFGMRYAAQQTHSVLRRMEAVGVVKRFPPVRNGEGRPALRWALTSNLKAEGSEAA
jgi:hypothetical protein